MIQLSRRQIATIRATFRQALGITSARRAPQVTFRATSTGLIVESVSHNVAIEHHLAGQFTPGVITVPYMALKRCEGRGYEPVEFTPADNNEVTLRWRDGGVPQSATSFQGEPAEYPSEPDRAVHVDRRIIRALADAAATVDTESTRYALNCVRLRGSDGQIAATDGRQALLQFGFSFPWPETLLVAASEVFGTKPFQSARDVHIGRSDDWVTVQADDWTVHLRIEKESRFPNLDDVAPAVDSTPVTELHISAGDADFLQTVAKRLPATSEFNSPVTVELNGCVAIRSRSADRLDVTEIVLSNSHRTGDEMRFSTNSRFLARAMQLGFRVVRLYGPERPAICRDDRRVYLWALLEKSGALKADPGAVRIESPAEGPSRTAGRRRTTRRPFPVAAEVVPG